MKMIVGLGNPGPRYARNRHNIGFQVLDRLASRHAVQLSRSKFNALYGEGWIVRPRGLKRAATACDSPPRQKVLLARPLTFMNRSGTAVASLARYFAVEAQNIFVIYDELDLPSGKLRLRPFGGAGGHNGMKSLIQQLGTERFPRARVGIGRPPALMDPAAYVLQDFSEEEESEFGPLRSRIADAVESWLFQGIDIAMNCFNG